MLYNTTYVIDKGIIRHEKFLELKTKKDNYILDP